MSNTLKEAFGELAEALENAGVALRKIEGAYGSAAAKSPNASGTSVPATGPAGKKGAANAAGVGGKPAGKGKASAPPAVTFDSVKAKLSELMDSKGKQVVKELLSEFGVAKLAELEEDSYADMQAKAVELLNAEEDEPEAGDDDDMFGP